MQRSPSQSQSAGHIGGLPQRPHARSQKVKPNASAASGAILVSLASETSIQGRTKRGPTSRQQLRSARRCESMPRLRVVWPQRRDRPNTKRQTAGACASSVRQGSHEAREGVPSNSDGAWERRANRVRGPIALRVSPNCVCVPWRMLEAQWENRARSQESRGRARRFSILSSDTWARRDRDLALAGLSGRSEA